MTETIKRTFTREELEDLDLPRPYGTDRVVILKNEIIGEHRWTVDRKLVFRIVGEQSEDEAWSVTYQRPATENQECDLWYDIDEVEATLVHRKEKVMVVWE